MSRRRSLVDDSPTTWEYDDQVWTPENYENEYGGLVTFRDALAHSRNIATIKVAERAGYGNVAELWRRLGVGSQPKPYPVHRARGVRGHAARDRDGIHHLPEHGAASGSCATS